MLESNSSLNADVASDIRTAAMTVLSGWSAPSAAGFEAFATQASAAAEALLALGPRAAKPLLEYADLLEAAQKAFNRARARADSAERDLDSAESSKDERRAESDLEDARADMSEAGQAALMANQAAAQAIEGLMGDIPPAPPAPGAPAGTGLLTGLGSLWNDDAFGVQLFPFHPSNDGFTSAKWFVDRLLDLGIGIAGGAAGARAAALRALGRPATLQALVRSLTFRIAGPGFFFSLSYARSSSRIRPSSAATAARWARVGRALPFAGAAIGIGSAGIDQYRSDANNPNLTQTDRVGRAVGVGTYVGGAAAGGAAIGTFFFPGVGTLGGAAIGAGAGLLFGAAAASIDPLKELSADAGQAVANGVEDAGDWAGDQVKKLPDLNPLW